MRAGMPISGTGIPAATSILSVDSATQITMTNGATSTGAGGSLVVAPFGVGDGSTTFNVPDSRGKSAQGTDATDRLGADVGATSPTITDPGHAHGGVTGAASAGTFLGGGVGSVPNAPHTHTITSGATGISIADGRGPRIVKRWVIKT
jgi:microcystin-dependent protein